MAAAQHRGADGLDGGGGAEQISQHVRLDAGLRVAGGQLHRAQHLYPKAAPKRLGLGVKPGVVVLAESEMGDAQRGRLAQDPGPGKAAVRLDGMDVQVCFHLSASS